MYVKLSIAGAIAILALTSPALAQNSLTKPSPNEKQLDWRKHGLDAARIGIELGPNSTTLTSADVEPIMGKTLVDHSGKSVGSIIKVQNDTKGQPMNVFVQLGKEQNAPVRTVPAHTINLRNGRIITSMSVAEVENIPNR